MIGTLRFVRWAALGLIVLLAIGVAVLELRPGGEPVAEDASAGTVSVPAGVSIGGPFHLVDDKGHTVTDADYRGRWMLVFFGYTNCPDECPLTLQKMAAALGKLGPLADKVAPLFVTVDPARDTPARLASYLENFDARIVGLTGPMSRLPPRQRRIVSTTRRPSTKSRAPTSSAIQPSCISWTRPAGSTRCWRRMPMPRNCLLSCERS